LINLPKPENYLLFIEQLKVSQYKVYNIRNIENMVSYKSGRGCALSGHMYHIDEQETCHLWREGAWLDANNAWILVLNNLFITRGCKLSVWEANLVSRNLIWRPSQQKNLTLVWIRSGWWNNLLKRTKKANWDV
jgi:hypothetical protein